MKSRIHQMQNHIPPQTAALVRVGRELLRIFCIEKTGTALRVRSLRLRLLRLRLLRLRSAQAAQAAEVAQAGTALRLRSGTAQMRPPRLPRVSAVNLLLIFGFLLFLLNTTSSAQNPDGSRVNWMTIEEAAKASKEQPRPVLMDFYTDWCGWCKRMMATTYADENIAAYINANFYPVKFNAEGKDTVMFQGKKYLPVSDAPRTTHPLAAELLQGNMMYPTTLFMNNYNKEKDEFGFKLLVPGYLDQKKLEPFLVYTLENVYRTTQAEDFNKTFERSFYDTTVNALIGEIPWKQPREVFDGNFQSEKKRLVFIHTGWCNSCRVMERGVFTDTLLKTVLDSLVMVDFNPEIQDPLFWNNTLYQRKANDNFPFHPLTLDLTRKNFVLPSIVVLDEKEAIIDAIPFYLPPALLKDILIFYSKDIYKQKSWADFQKEGGK